MGEIVYLADVERLPRDADGAEVMHCVVRPFPGERHLAMVENIARLLNDLSDDAADQFLVEHFDIEWDRLTAQGVSEPEIEKYIFTTARAIWLRLRKAGAVMA
jgi:hypothetical protein